MLDDTGALVNREEYTPYGETSFGSFARKRYRFTGKERDEESGLSYHGARYYTPWLGRWTAADPAGMVDGLNLYRYSKNAPLNWADPSGLDPVPPNIANMSAEEVNARYAGRPEDKPASAESIQTVEKKEPPPHTAPKPEKFREHVPLASFFLGIPTQYVRPYQPVPEGAPVGLAAIRQMNGQPGVGVANFSRDVAPGTSVTNLTVQSVNVIAGAVGALAPMAGEAAKLAAMATMAEARAAQNQSVTVARFCDITDMQTLLPRAAKESEKVAAKVTSQLQDAEWVAARAEWHAAQGIVERSPFVSVGTDVGKLASSKDPILRTIVTGSPGAPGYARAPHIATFDVPANRLITPQNTLSGHETERLFLGSDLAKFLIKVEQNPF